jgi:glutaconate CoA-transferase, subunit A
MDLNTAHLKAEPSKIITLKEAIDKYVSDGCHIALGGSTANRNPMAAIYEIIRQKRKALHMSGCIMGPGHDLLIGADCVSSVELGYFGVGRYAPTAPNFKRCAEAGRIRFEDYSNYQMALRFLAGAMGIPFLPTKSGLGSDILEKWGFDTGLRESDNRMANKKLVILDNPFNQSSGNPVVLLPSINPDVSIIHVQKVDIRGTVRIEGLTFADVELAKAASHLIVTCEEIIENWSLQAQPESNQIPSFFIDAIVKLPKGAHPTQCYNYYDLDTRFIHRLIDSSVSDDKLENFLEEYVWSLANHDEYLEKIGGEVFDSISAEPCLGYRSHLDRTKDKL